MAVYVLIVDDDADFRSLARRMIAGLGLTVIGEADTVTSGAAAAVELRPGAVLLDVMLPDGDGVSLARQLTAMAWRPRVLLTSNSPDAAAAIDIASSGAVGFVPKHELPSAPLLSLLVGEDGLRINESDI